MGNFYRETQRFSEAEQALQEALTTWGQLVQAIEEAVLLIYGRLHEMVTVVLREHFKIWAKEHTEKMYNHGQ